MKRRFLSGFMALVMAMSLLPMSAFAAATEQYDSSKTYAPGAEVLSATEPAADNLTDNVVWVKVEETGTPMITCSGHDHEKECYAFTCGHDYGHTQNCYTGGEPGKWIVCENNSESEGRMSSEVVKHFSNRF